MKRTLSILGIAGSIIVPILLAGSAWAGAPSITPEMPPEILSWRDEILPRGEYRELAEQWRTYIDEHPRSAVAYVQLARAQRYGNTAPVEERQRLVLKAYEIDPDCPEVLDAIGDTGLHSASPMVTMEEAIEYLERAIELAPDWTYPHFNTWSHLVILGREKEAQEHLRILIEKGGFPPPLLDFCYNMLVSAEPEAIIFTNGDNDTYPPLALQAAYGIRTDVTIVNLSLLNRIEYARSVWKKAFGNKGPLKDKEIKKIHSRWKKESETSDWELFSAKILRAICGKIQDGKWKKPVYLALTVSSANMSPCRQARELEGLLWRVKQESEDDPECGEDAVNFAKTRRMFQEEFRLDSATDLVFPWTLHSAIRPLMTNYPAVLRLVAAESAKLGDLETVRFALREAIRILDFHGQSEMVKKMARYWKELDPDNPEVERWL